MGLKIYHVGLKICSMIMYIPRMAEGVLRMHCIDTEALVFMFNGCSSNGFTIHPISLKGPLLVYTDHINNCHLPML